MRQSSFAVLLAAFAFLAGCQPRPADTETIRTRAEAGDAEAQFLLGYMYSEGEGVSEDDREAVKWYRKAAEQGHANAQYELGWLYSSGNDVGGPGVPVDDRESVKWVRKAAEQEHIRAQIYLANCYARGGCGLSQDYGEAMKWYRQAVEEYRKAAEQGHVSAQLSLGRIYRRGEGVPQNYIKAHAWLNLAAAQENLCGSTAGSYVRPYAVERDTLKSNMTPDEIVEAQKLAARIWQRIESLNQKSQ